MVTTIVRLRSCYNKAYSKNHPSFKMPQVNTMLSVNSGPQSHPKDG
jgi:hypothetical protein